MVDEEMFHDLTCQAQECRLLLVAWVATISQCSDLHQRQIQLIHEHGGLPGVFRALAFHLGRGQSSQFWV